MKIIISNRSGVPIYEQIKIQIKEAIYSGQLQAEEMLPSIRGLAKELKVSVITTTRAYNDLEEEGFIASVQGKGCFVLPQNKEMARENALKKIEACLEEAIEIAHVNGIERENIVTILDILWGVE